MDRTRLAPKIPQRDLFMAIKTSQVGTKIYGHQDKSGWYQVIHDHFNQTKLQLVIYKCKNPPHGGVPYMLGYLWLSDASSSRAKGFRQNMNNRQVHQVTYFD